MPDPHTPLSRHGRLRLAQRGISPVAVDATLAWGRSVRTHGCELFRLDRRSVCAAEARGADVARYEGTHVILGRAGAVVTAYRSRCCRRVRR
jgi:hypothetical protein